jgi:hypothetical protein
MSEEKTSFPSSATIIGVIGIVFAAPVAYIQIKDSHNGESRVMVFAFLVGLGLMLWSVQLWVSKSRELQSRIDVERKNILEALALVNETVSTQLRNHQKWAVGQNGVIERVVIDGIKKWESYWQTLNKRIAELENSTSSSTASSQPSPQSENAS